MTRLDKIELGTDHESGWRYYSLHETGVQVLKEFFFISNYRRCIKNAFDYHERTEKNLDLLERKGRPFPQKSSVVAGAKELSDWAKKMDSENYHDLYVNAFIGMWASFESGLENIIRDYVLNDKDVAVVLSGLFKDGRYKIEEWTWTFDICTEIAGKIDSKTKPEKNAKRDEWRYANRLQKMFKWMGINIELSETEKAALDEANCMRNILLHQYGKISRKNAQDFPVLEKWVSGVMPINKEIFLKYYNGIIAVLKKAMTNTKHADIEG